MQQKGFKRKHIPTTHVHGLYFWKHFTAGVEDELKTCEVDLSCQSTESSDIRKLFYTNFTLLEVETLKWQQEKWVTVKRNISIMYFTIYDSIKRNDVQCFKSRRGFLNPNCKNRPTFKEAAIFFVQVHTDALTNYNLNIFLSLYNR